ncbi:TetR/AcrR family transcriptional regulator [Virgibacillus dakarensis]|nr:TetR/AcrR family transcriptional regulator [Virgibacillus dakarensis]
MRKKLIDAALRHYSLHGYQGATMRKIATDVGIKPASIYFFYKNKEALFIDAFQQLLDNHFHAMERALQENKDKPIEQILSAMLHGSVTHHKDDEPGTKAYISLVTAPIPEIKQHLTSHMQRYNDWLVDSLEAALKSSYPLMPSREVARVIKQFVLIGNGVFWGINLYEGKDFAEQVDLADQMIQTLVLELNQNCQNI